MNRIPPSVLIIRIISAVIIIGSLYMHAERTEDIPAEDNGFKDNMERKEYELIDINTYSIPAYNSSVISLFTVDNTTDRENTKKQETAITKPVPDLSFIGVVENEKGKIYSFRNRDTGKIILLKKGVKSGEITLSGIEDNKFIMNIENHIFTVARQ